VAAATVLPKLKETANKKTFRESPERRCKCMYVYVYVYVSVGGR